MPLSAYMIDLQQRKLGIRPSPEKKEAKPLARIGEAGKRNAKEDSAHEKELDIWFKEIRKKLTGFCQCGCGEKSQKKNDPFFKASICHIFPKSIFPSVATHPLNYVERAMFGGCHSNMDNRSMKLWPGMEDWDSIKAKFLVLEKCLTKEEKGKKFYNMLKDLISKN